MSKKHSLVTDEPAFRDEQHVDGVVVIEAADFLTFLAPQIGPAFLLDKHSVAKVEGLAHFRAVAINIL